MALKLFRSGSSEAGLFIKALIAGEPGAGKTRTASTWPDPLYLSAEGGLLSVRDRDVPAFKITSSDEIMQVLNILKLGPAITEQKLGVPVKTVVIDTLDEVQRILVKERLLDKRQESMQQADWGWLGDQLRGIVRAFRNLDLHVVVTTHVKTSEDGETGRITVKPMIQGSMGDELAGYFDLVVLLAARPMSKVIDGEATRVLVRVAQTYPDGHTTWLKDRSGRLPMELEVNFEDDFDRMFTMIFGDIAGSDPESIVTQAEAVVREVEPVPTPAAEPVAAKKTGAAKQPPVRPPGLDKPAAAPAAAAEPQQGAVAVAERPEPPAVTDQAEAAPAAETAPEPQPEPAPAPEPEAAPEPEPQPELTAAETAPPEGVDAETGEITQPTLAEETVPDAGTVADDTMTCEVCGGAIESPEDSELSWIRYRKRLCNKDFNAQKSSRR